MNESPATRPATVPAHIEALRQQLERLGCEPSRRAARLSGKPHPSQDPPPFSAGK